MLHGCLHGFAKKSPNSSKSLARQIGIFFALKRLLGPSSVFLSFMVDPSPKNRRKSSRTARVWILSITTVVLILFGLIVIQTQGNIKGTEFSPTHFQQRHFRFYEIPLIHLQITPIKRTNSSNDTAIYLRQKSLIQTPTGPPMVWHLAELSNNLGGTKKAPPMLLIDQLNRFADDKGLWHQWSLDHPAHADFLWPIVQKLAKRELYILLPSLFEIAAMDQTAIELTQRCETYLTTEYENLIDDLLAAQRSDIAAQLLAEAKQDYPLDPRWSRFQLSLPPQPTSPPTVHDLPR